jgi:hypothetical protein
MDRSKNKKSQEASKVDNNPAKDLHNLAEQELSGSDLDESESLEASETDDDENEGVGDGNMGGNRIDDRDG